MVAGAYSVAAFQKELRFGNNIKMRINQMPYMPALGSLSSNHTRTLHALLLVPLVFSSSKNL
jgi:hypothetical protein